MSLLEMQSEVGEFAEARASGKGCSSAMPHKHNPVDSIAAIAAATVTPQLAGGLFAAMAQEHERGAGTWHAEWILLPQLCSISHQALLSVLEIFQGLRVDTDRMRENLAATLGLSAASALANALAPLLGRDAAHSTVKSLSGAKATRERRHLRDVVTASDTSLSEAEITEVLHRARRDSCRGTRTAVSTTAR